MSKHKPVAVDTRRQKPQAQAWDFEGRTFRFNHRYKSFTIDTKNGSRSPSKWTPAEHNSFARFEALPVEDRKPHRKCVTCRKDSAAPGANRCNRCMNIARGAHAETCSVDGCENPRKESYGYLSRLCAFHYRAHEAEVRREREERKGRPRVDYAETEESPRRVADRPPALPYAFRAFSARGTLSEALRIDTGGQK